MTRSERGYAPTSEGTSSSTSGSGSPTASRTAASPSSTRPDASSWNRTRSWQGCSRPEGVRLRADEHTPGPARICPRSDLPPAEAFGMRDETRHCRILAQYRVCIDHCHPLSAKDGAEVGGREPRLHGGPTRCAAVPDGVECEVRAQLVTELRGEEDTAGLAQASADGLQMPQSVMQRPGPGMVVRAHDHDRDQSHSSTQYGHRSPRSEGLDDRRDRVPEQDHDREREAVEVFGSRAFSEGDDERRERDAREQRDCPSLVAEPPAPERPAAEAEDEPGGKDGEQRGGPEPGGGSMLPHREETGVVAGTGLAEKADLQAAQQEVPVPGNEARHGVRVLTQRAAESRHGLPECSLHERAAVGPRAAGEEIWMPLLIRERVDLTHVELLLGRQSSPHLVTLDVRAPVGPAEEHCDHEKRYAVRLQ